MTFSYMFTISVIIRLLDGSYDAILAAAALLILSLNAGFARFL